MGRDGGEPPRKGYWAEVGPERMLLGYVIAL